MDSNSHNYNQAISRDSDEDPYNGNWRTDYNKAPTLKMLQKDISELARVEAIDSKSAKKESNGILEKFADDINHDVAKSNEYFVKIKALEYLSSFLTIANTIVKLFYN